MAVDIVDCYEMLSNGMFSGTANEAIITPTERYIRILSFGLLDSAPTPLVGGTISKILTAGRYGIDATFASLRAG